MCAKHEASYVALFDGDFGSSINSWIDIFERDGSLHIFRNILDYGLGVIYNHVQWRISSQIQSKMFDILPWRYKFKIKHNYFSKPMKNKKQIKIHFVQIRQQIYELPPQSLQNYLNKLSSIMSNKISVAIKFGFDKYKYQLSSNILSHLISNRITEQTLIYAYCRLSAKLTHNKFIPIDIIQLCHYHYFILYITAHPNDIESYFGNEFGMNSLNYKHIDWSNIDHNMCDSWNSYLSHPFIKTSSNHLIQRKQPQTKQLTLYNAFGNEIVELGQRKKWKLKIKPYIGNLTIGICDTTKCVASNLFSDCNPEFCELYYGFGLLVADARIESLGEFIKDVSAAHHVSLWEEVEYVITMELDMRINEDKPHCTLKYTVNDYDWGVVLDREIDKTKRYRLAISCVEEQTIELINDCCSQYIDTDNESSSNKKDANVQIIADEENKIDVPESNINIVQLIDPVPLKMQVVNEQGVHRISIRDNASLFSVNKENEIKFWCEYLYEAYGIFGETMKPFDLFFLGVNIKLLYQTFFATQFSLTPKFLAAAAWIIIDIISASKPFISLNTLKYDIVDIVCDGWNKYVSNPKMKGMIKLAVNNEYTPHISTKLPSIYAKYGRSPLCGYLLHVDENLKTKPQEQSERIIGLNSKQIVLLQELTIRLKESLNKLNNNNNDNMIINVSPDSMFVIIRNKFISSFKEEDEILWPSPIGFSETLTFFDETQIKQRYLSPNDYHWKLKNRQRRSTFKKSHKVRNKNYFKTNYTRRRW